MGESSNKKIVLGKKEFLNWFVLAWMLVSCREFACLLLVTYVTFRMHQSSKENLNITTGSRWLSLALERWTVSGGTLERR